MNISMAGINDGLRETAANTENLAGLAEMLNGEVSFFKT
jgi:hypothetical protein